LVGFEEVYSCAGIAEPCAPRFGRTYARLAHQGRAQLEQIQMSLGHASIQTTERYLGFKQDLTDAPCDHLGLKLCPAPTEAEQAA